MKFLSFLAFAGALYAIPLPAPDLTIDQLPVVSPNIGAAVIPTGSMQLFLVCLNDNPANSPYNDHDYNDSCASAQYGPGNVLSVTYIGALSSAINFIGVWGQWGWVGPGFPQQDFTYTPGVETIFAGYVNGGFTAIYLSGSGGAVSSPPGDYFYTECLLCAGEDVGSVPEPAGFLLTAMGLTGLAWWRRSLRGAAKSRPTPAG